MTDVLKQDAPKFAHNMQTLRTLQAHGDRQQVQLPIDCLQDWPLSSCTRTMDSNPCIPQANAGQVRPGCHAEGHGPHLYHVLLV